MKDCTMQQYLAQIKILVDNITAAGSNVDTEDIILYILNDLLHKLIKNTFNSSIQTFRSNGGGEFISNAFRIYLLNNVLTNQISCPYTPEQNDLNERKHRHLLGLTRMLLHAAHLPNPFRAEAISTANYLINRLPSSAISNQTPYSRLHGQLVTYTHLRTFRCLCFLWLQPQAQNKLSPRS
ncbi:Retrovirus-related Pol polyprotein from transposon TNT 1-94 [Dendrobium catenatum]|uniref:Retrovirus-related Pol polyprotein from transposon TNT 1-94 n=1 Tax=Dendrobium catenatum TaxID=906689 RepID=A0A2I0VLV4_9ASPA|nr:Retrovirus-related Pol polyprotein from transposon TNT 1-94 [Dendrobium catenatum]